MVQKSIQNQLCIIILQMQNVGGKAGHRVQIWIKSKKSGHFIGGWGFGDIIVVMDSRRFWGIINSI